VVPKAHAMLAMPERFNLKVARAIVCAARFRLTNAFVLNRAARVVAGYWTLGM
jgi:hypothetical protein